MLFPAIEIDDPAATIIAPAAPRNRTAPSASGVRDCAIPGNTPVATIEVSVITVVTISSVTTNANGTSRRGFAASPARIPVTS
jgi:hypothetical protein